MSMSAAEEGEVALADRLRVRAAVHQHVLKLRDTDPNIAARAAESLFELGVKGGYASVVATRNRQEIGMTDGVFTGFAHLVRHGTDEGQGWACAALAQIAFDNANNCIAIVRTPGMLAGLRQVMENSTRDSKAAAALAVNNISAFSEQASAIIVQADVVNINEADVGALASLPCIPSSAVANNICQHRAEHGAFRDWDALARVAGVTPRMVEAIKASRRPNLTLSREPPLLPPLQALCRGEYTDARTDAVGALNHMSRSQQARQVLLDHCVVAQALGPALQAEYDNAEELAAIVARATMAIANLMAHGPEEGALDDAETEAGGEEPELMDGVEEDGRLHAQHHLYKRPIADYVLICSPQGSGCMELRQGALGILVRCLRYALKGEKWVGITWGTFSVLHALRNLAAAPVNQRLLCASGLVELLVDLLHLWTRQFKLPSAPRAVQIQSRELQLSLEMLVSLSKRARARHTMRTQGVVALLEVVGRSEAEYGSVDVWHWLIRDRHLALCMGQHPRLGVNSRFAALDPAVMRLIVEYVCASGGTKVMAQSLASLLQQDHQSNCMVSG